MQGIMETCYGLSITGMIYIMIVDFHSDDPNCYVQTYIIKGEPKVTMVALKNIAKGAFLSFDYGDDAEEVITTPSMRIIV